MYNQSDIVLMPFPYTDLTLAKLRPALIISNNNLKGNDAICCLVTSQPNTEGILLSKFTRGNLPYKSWVKPHRIFTIDKTIIKKRLCTIEPELQKTILNKLVSFVD